MPTSRLFWKPSTPSLASRLFVYTVLITSRLDQTFVTGRRCGSQSLPPKSPPHTRSNLNFMQSSSPSVPSGTAFLPSVLSSANKPTHTIPLDPTLITDMEKEANAIGEELQRLMDRIKGRMEQVCSGAGSGRGTPGAGEANEALRVVDHMTSMIRWMDTLTRDAYNSRTPRRSQQPRLRLPSTRRLHARFPHLSWHQPPNSTSL